MLFGHLIYQLNESAVSLRGVDAARHNTFVRASPTRCPKRNLVRSLASGRQDMRYGSFRFVNQSDASIPKEEGAAAGGLLAGGRRGTEQSAVARNAC